MRGFLPYGAAFAFLLLATGCGLFHSEPDPPSLRSVEVARAREAGEWALLAEVWRLHRQDPKAARVRARELSQEYPGSVRLAVLAQDLAFELGDPQVQREVAARLEEENPTALNAYLRARVVENREERRRLLKLALERDDELLQARVRLLAMEAHDGRRDVLEELIDVLREDPGLAEGWRLLGELGRQYARADLVQVAVATEPWSPGESEEWLVLARAHTAMAAGDPELTLSELRSLPVDHREACLLRAGALAELERPQVAFDLLLTLVARDPMDPEALFNLGLLERDYLFRPARSAYWLRRFLEADVERGGTELQRRAQAEIWIAEADAGLRRGEG